MKGVLEIYWKQGSRFRVTPEIAHAEIEKIRAKNNGDVTPEALVKIAKPARSPLHGEFEWDDATAAHQHRLERARGMIRSIEVVRSAAPKVQSRQYELARVVDEEDETSPVRRVYRTTEDIMANPQLRNCLLMDAIRDAASYRKRYAGLSELEQVFGAMDNLFAHVKKTG